MFNICNKDMIYVNQSWLNYETYTISLVLWAFRTRFRSMFPRLFTKENMWKSWESTVAPLLLTFFCSFITEVVKSLGPGVIFPGLVFYFLTVWHWRTNILTFRSKYLDSISGSKFFSFSSDLLSVSETHNLPFPETVLSFF